MIFMDQHLFEAVLNSLLEKNNTKAYITVDDLMDVLDEYDVPITKTDYVAAMINGMGFRIFTHPPSDEELLAIQDEDNDTSNPDYAQIDYEAVYREVLEIDPGLKCIISYIRGIRPAQHGEANYLFRHINNERKKRLFDMSLRSVVRIALSISQSEDADLADLIQQGALGLLKAIEKYDVDSESAFGTYANYWIFQTISRSTLYHRNGCYFPVYISDTIKRVNLALERMDYDSGDAPFCLQQIIHRVSTECNITTKQVEAILVYLQDSISIEVARELEDEGDNTFSDSGIFEIEMVSGIFRKAQRDSVDKVLSMKLNERQKEVIMLRNGFYGGHCYTLEECGYKYGLTRERIRQIENVVQRKLKRYLKPIIDDADSLE